MRLFLALLFAFQLFFHSSSAAAASSQYIKTKYIYNFFKFIEWPDTLSKDIYRVCIVGTDSVADELHTLSGRIPRNGTPIFIETGINNSNLKNCHLVYISTSESKFLTSILSQIGNAPVVTVSSIEDFTLKGGIIEFKRYGNVIRFNIDLKQAHSSNLRFRAKLIEVAEKVIMP